LMCLFAAVFYFSDLGKSETEKARDVFIKKASIELNNLSVSKEENSKLAYQMASFSPSAGNISKMLIDMQNFDILMQKSLQQIAALKKESDPKKINQLTYEVKGNIYQCKHFLDNLMGEIFNYGKKSNSG